MGLRGAIVSSLFAGLKRYTVRNGSHINIGCSLIRNQRVPAPTLRRGYTFYGRMLYINTDQPKVGSQINTNLGWAYRYTTGSR